ncbi:hypothetical protein [Galbibacter sp.]|uniref:hypothetical protein n=1 Tax=Galbibacter sp. TaxID=2918471 RepID=UPI003A93BFBE
MNCLNFKEPLKLIGLLFLVIPALLFSQNSPTYEELQSMQYAAVHKGDIVQLRKISKIQFEKACLEKDSLQMAKALYQRALEEDYEKGLELADSIILLTEKGNYKWYPAEGYIIKAYRHYMAGDYLESLNSYIEGHEIALSKGNMDQVNSTLTSIAAIKSNNGHHAEALDLYRESLGRFNDSEELSAINYDDYLMLHYNISLSYLKLYNLDSARYVINKGIPIALKFGDTMYYRDLITANAQIDYYDGNYLKSRDSLYKYIGYYDGIDQAEKEYYLGKIAGKMRDSVTMFNYFMSIDSIVTEIDIPVDNMEDVYQLLLIKSSKENNKEQQLEYINKLIYFDSINSTLRSGLNQLATVGFNVPMLQREKKQLLSEINGRDRVILYLYAAAGFSLCFTVFVFYKNYKIKRKLNLLMNTKVEPIHSNRNEKIELQLSSDILAKIKNGLDLFEREKGFLDPGITQESLAKNLGTNSSYLSMVINSEKGINFSRYLKDLRVTYAINFLKANPEISTKYTMKGMSELFGFKSADSFSRALSSKIDVSASDYLKRIKKES